MPFNNDLVPCSTAETRATGIKETWLKRIEEILSLLRNPIANVYILASKCSYVKKMRVEIGVKTRHKVVFYKS